MLARKLDYDYYKQTEYAAPEKKAEKFVLHEEVECDSQLRKKALAIVAMVLFFAFYLVMRNDVMIQNGYTLGALKKQEVEMMKNVDYMQVNLAKAKSPERITVLAGQIGMVTAEQNIYVGGANSEIKPEQKEENISVAWKNN